MESEFWSDGSYTNRNILSPQKRCIHPAFFPIDSDRTLSISISLSRSIPSPFSLSPLSTAMATPDLLFGLRNNFYLGAYQVAINNSEISILSPEDAIERDSLVYRSYIALGSYQVSLQSLCLSDLLKDPVNWLSFCLIWFSWWLMRLTRMHLRHFRLSSSSLFISLVQKIRFVFY